MRVSFSLGFLNVDTTVHLLACVSNMAELKLMME
jgi:hypothetical protein